MSLWISNILQIAVGLGLLSVWLVRARSATSYRGGGAQNLKEEFAEYGLPPTAFYVVGALKIAAGVILIAGIWFDLPVQTAAGVVALLMLGAVVMHVKVKDPAHKALPAVLMLAMSATIVLLR